MVDADDQGRWQVTKGGKSFLLDVVVCAPAQTVDYLREVAPGIRSGAFIRVLPRVRGGSVIVMTLPIVPGVSAEETANVLDGELRALITICVSR